MLATCLADAFRPELVYATCALVEYGLANGSDAELPREQTCCGQPLYNSGDRDGAIAQAKRVIDLFERYDAIVVPSGSCAGMLRLHYPSLLQDTPYARRADAFKEKVMELTEFLVKKSYFLERVKDLAPASLANSFVTWHDSCSCLRENDGGACARGLLERRGFTVRESENCEVCCGFGGKFSVAHGAISTSMADDKLACLRASGASIVSSSDFGCLLHLAGRARRRGLELSFFHIAELLALGVGRALGSQKITPIGY